MATYHCLKSEMKYKMVHSKKNKHDMNLVVGAVLLITCMIALSVAVDAWAGKPAQFYPIEGFTASSFAFSNGNTITVVIENNGTVPSEIGEVWINNEKQTFTLNSMNEGVPPENHIILSMFYAYSNATNYNFKMISKRGNTYSFTAAVP
jgi:hypothetical protein